VRSGVLTSVHAFATDPRRGIFILAFLAVVIGGSLALFAWRAPKVGLGGGFALVSRESMLLTNNVLLVVAAGSVLLGTLYPLFLDALNLGKISVGPPYFDSVFVPLMTPALFLMGIGPLARWKEASLPDILTRLKWAIGVSVVTALAVPFVMGKWSIMVAFGVLLAAWILAASAVNLKQRVAGRAGSLGARLASQPRGYYGMLLAHCGVAVFILGVTLVKGYETERDMRMAVGDSVTIGRYAFRFDGTVNVTGPNYRASRGNVAVSRDGQPLKVMHPEKRVYNAQQMGMTEAAISTGPFGDIYVSLGEPVADGAWSVRVYHKPFVTWIWGGCILMALGGFFALTDRRYRRVARSETAPVDAAAQPAAA
jgi:cytochrome c-type biogenesis protein CcmF